MSELVVDTDAAHQGGALLAEQGAHRLTQAADDGVLLAGDDLSALLGRLQHQLLVQRLDGGHVDDSGADPGFLQGLARLQRLIGEQAGGDDSHVGAVHEHLALADLEGEAILLVEHRHGGAAEAHVHGALMLIGRLHHGPGLHVVGGGHDHHAGDGAHQGEVLTALVGGPVLAHGDAAVGGTDLHIQVGVADGVANLLKGAAGGKHGEAGGKGDQSHGGGAGGSRHHIRLGDAAVKVAVGERLLEYGGLGGAGQVGVEHDQVGMGGAQLSQRAAIAVPGRDLLHICHLTSPPLLPGGLSARPWRSCTPRRWGPYRASLPRPP